MKLPGGRLVRSRVVADPRTVLLDALDRELTGYAVLEPQGSLLLDADGDGVVTFREGIPVVAYHTGTERGGPPALADLAAEGPYRQELFAVDASDLSAVHGQESFRVPPEMPAERLAGDQALADRTRAALAATDHPLSGCDDGSRAGPSDGRPAAGPTASGPVEAFLDDREKIEAIREEARAEAERRAEEWGFAGSEAGTGS